MPGTQTELPGTKQTLTEVQKAALSWGTALDRVHDAKESADKFKVDLVKAMMRAKKTEVKVRDSLDRVHVVTVDYKEKVTHKIINEPKTDRIGEGD